jgi:hypothetical protein
MGVDVRESALGTLIAEKELGVVEDGCGWALMAVKPVFTAVKPDDIGGRDASGGGVAVASLCKEALRAVDAFTAGESTG